MDARLVPTQPEPLPHRGLFDWLDARHKGLLEWMQQNPPQTWVGYPRFEGGVPYQQGPLAGGLIRRPRQRLNDPRLRRWIEDTYANGQRTWRYDADPANRWRVVQDNFEER